MDKANKYEYRLPISVGINYFIGYVMYSDTYTSHRDKMCKYEYMVVDVSIESQGIMPMKVSIVSNGNTIQTNANTKCLKQLLEISHKIDAATRNTRKYRQAVINYVANVVEAVIVLCDSIPNTMHIAASNNM